VARVSLSVTAVEDLDRLVLTHSLPGDTRDRVARALRRLQQFPRMGPVLEGAWSRYRFVLGPWRWLLIVYAYDEERDSVLVVTMLDARSSSAATSD
jgi:plasmid stabilization system protein ParE